MTLHNQIKPEPASTKSGAERRVAPRRAMHIMADITLPGDLTMIGHTMDMSIGGLRAEVPYMLESGQECVIELDLTHLGGPSYLKLVAEVRHCQDNGSGRMHAGMQFKNIDAETAEILQSLF
ncbi:MAG TPA: PilZ domain-containing protein [Steroidobacteraceae bacterium]|jgi:hypothetical protein|nr:PilZ domain-containing protein [Steroidobacteraceae bacterium]